MTIKADGPLLGSMMIDIYASKSKDAAWILHRPAFAGTLSFLMFDSKAGRLDFVFTDGTVRTLGSDIKPVIAPYLAKAKDITLIEIDQDDDVVNTIIAPLEVV